MPPGRRWREIPASNDQQAFLARILKLPGAQFGGMIAQVGTDNVLRTVTVVVPDGDMRALNQIVETVTLGNVV